MPLTTKICLNCCKTLQENGTSLYLCGNTEIQNTGTLKYSTDQTESYICLSIPHVGFVTGLTNSISTNLNTNYYNKIEIDSYTGSTDIRINTIEEITNVAVTGATTPLEVVNNKVQFDYTRCNVCLGIGTLTGNTTGVANTAIGDLALNNNTIGNHNVGIGYGALLNNISGCHNIAQGCYTLKDNTLGKSNIAFGRGSLNKNVSGSWNVGIGNLTLQNNLTGNDNLGFGYGAMWYNYSGSCNIAFGYQALYCNGIGNYNIAQGISAGYESLGSYNIYIGQCAGCAETGSNKIYIGCGDVNGDTLICGDSSAKTLRISGATTITGQLTLSLVNISSVSTDDVMVIDSSGVVKKITKSSLGDKNNIYSHTAVTSNVTLSTGSSYVILVNSSTEITITLPTTPINGQVFKIKDISGLALNNNIIINGNGKNIDGYSMARINTDYGAFELMYNGTAWYTLSFVN